MPATIPAAPLELVRSPAFQTHPVALRSGDQSGAARCRKLAFLLGLLAAPAALFAQPCFQPTSYMVQANPVPIADDDLNA